MDQLKDTLSAVDVTLSPEHSARLDEVSRIELGFPHDFLRQDFVRGFMTGNTTVEKG